MRSNRVLEEVAVVGAAITTLTGVRTDILTTQERLESLEALAALTHRLAAVENTLITGLQRQATHAELAGSLADTLSRVTRTTSAEAKRRIKDAEDTATGTALDTDGSPSCSAR